jgi:hypothetical protein
VRRSKTRAGRVPVGDPLRQVTTPRTVHSFTPESSAGKGAVYSLPVLRVEADLVSLGVVHQTPAVSDRMMDRRLGYRGRAKGHRLAMRELREVRTWPGGRGLSPFGEARRSLA